MQSLENRKYSVLDPRANVANIFVHSLGWTWMAWKHYYFCYILGFISRTDGMSGEVSFSPSNWAIKIPNEVKGRFSQT